MYNYLGGKECTIESFSYLSMIKKKNTTQVCEYKSAEVLDATFKEKQINKISPFEI